jgi:hypothetical protein
LREFRVVRCKQEFQKYYGASWINVKRRTRRHRLGDPHHRVSQVLAILRTLCCYTTVPTILCGAHVCYRGLPLDNWRYVNGQHCYWLITKPLALQCEISETSNPYSPNMEIRLRCDVSSLCSYDPPLGTTLYLASKRPVAPTP